MPDLTITLTNAQVNRVRPALGTRLNLGRDATAAEAETWLKQQLRIMVRQEEQRPLMRAAADSVPDL